MKKFEDLLGKTLTSIVNNDDRELIFTLSTGEKCMLYHSQWCAEDVRIEDICGDLNDLIGSPILLAEEVSSHENPPDTNKEHQGSFTWTFYKLATVKGYVTIRWYGESNGYYSESVDFRMLDESY